MTDVWFARNLTLTREEIVEVSADIGDLPNAIGYGHSRSLHQAMMRDESGELQSLVTQFVNAATRQERLALTEQIIFSWTGQEGEYRPHYQSPVDARRIGALEAFYGYALDRPRGSGRQYAAIYDGIFESVADTVFYQLSAQTHLSSFLREVTWERNTETGEWEGDFSQVVGNLFDYVEAHPQQAQDVLQDFVHAIRGVNPYSNINENLQRSAVDQFILTADLSSYSEETIGIVVAATLNASDGADYVNGNNNNNVLFGLDGNDTIVGNAGDDVLDGGAGDDVLTGGSGNDEYRFGIGYGSDRVRNSDSGAGRYDVVRLIGGLTAADVTLTRQGDDLVIAINGADAMLRVESHFDQEGASKRYVNSIVFDDGTVLDVGPSQFDEINLVSQSITDGNDELHGTSVSDALDGLSGDDQIYGKDGDDWLIGREGNDTLHGDAGADLLVGGVGNDQLFGDEGDDHLVGGSGHDSLHGGLGDDILGGDQGDDLLSGGQGDDYYLFNLGDGLDVIDNKGGSGDIDNLILGNGILSEDVHIRRSGSDMLIVVRDGEDEIRVRNFYKNEASRIDNIVFNDPMSTLASLDAATLETLASQVTEKADELHGGSSADTLDGLGGDDLLVGGAGDDTLYGSQGNDELQGDDGNDRLYGGEGNDTLDGGYHADYLDGGAGDDTLTTYDYDGGTRFRGGTGNDVLNGSRREDIYYYKLGDGQDVIDERGGRTNHTDWLVLEGLNPSDVVFTREDDTLVMDMPDGVRSRCRTGTVMTKTAWKK